MIGYHENAMMRDTADAIPLAASDGETVKAPANAAVVITRYAFLPKRK